MTNITFIDKPNQVAKHGKEIRNLFLEYYYEICSFLQTLIGPLKASQVQFIKPINKCTPQIYTLQSSSSETNNNSNVTINDINYCCDSSLAVARAKLLETRFGVEFEVEDGEGLQICVQSLLAKHPYSQYYILFK